MVIVVLRAPQYFWSGSPPSSGSGTIDFAVRRVVFETLLAKTIVEKTDFKRLEEKLTRFSWATELEAALKAAEVQPEPEVP